MGFSSANHALLSFIPILSLSCDGKEQLVKELLLSYHVQLLSVSGSSYWLTATTQDVLQKALSEIHSGDSSVFFYCPNYTCDTARGRFNFQRVRVRAVMEVEFPFCQKFYFSAWYKNEKLRVFPQNKICVLNLGRWKHFYTLVLFWEASRII